MGDDIDRDDIAAVDPSLAEPEVLETVVGAGAPEAPGEQPVEPGAPGAAEGPRRRNPPRRAPSTG